MRLLDPLPVTELAEQLSAELRGDQSLQITGINEVHHVEPGDLTFVDHPKYYQKALHSAASVMLIDQSVEPPVGKAILIVDHPFDEYDRLVRKYRPEQHLSHTIDPTAQIGTGTVVEAGVMIGPNVRIGRNSHIQAGVIIREHCLLGDEVLIQSGSVIGADAFYFKKTEAGFRKWRSGGRVIIEDRVDIGANCTINRGVSSDTVIGAGTKIDCLVQIGHDTKVGTNCLFAAQVGIAGNCRIGNNVVLYGQAGIGQNIHIPDGVLVSAKGGVNKDLEAGKSYFGIPVREARTAYREILALKQLPNFLKTVKHKGH